MLRYLGTGERYYGMAPHGVYPRRHWELQAVVAGQMAPLLESGPLPFRSQSLWIFTPDCPHGWLGYEREACEVVVFHFTTVPDQLRQCVDPHGYIETGLSADECVRLRELANVAAENLRHPTTLSNLYYQQIQTEVSLMALKQQSHQRLGDGDAAAQQMVDNAIAWFEEHMAEAPRLEDVAAAIYISPAHFRRLFHRVLGLSPRQALDQVRFVRAMQLMERGQFTIDAVARACGLGSASAFSRAFKKWHGCSPRDWLRARTPRHRKA